MSKQGVTIHHVPSNSEGECSGTFAATARARGEGYKESSGYEQMDNELKETGGQYFTPRHLVPGEVKEVFKYFLFILICYLMIRPMMLTLKLLRHGLCILKNLA